MLCSPPLERIMGKVAVRARRPHYRDHIQPVWDALPDDVKWEGPWIQHGPPTLLVAGASDIVHGRPYIYLEHGSGQSYLGVDRAAYSGGSHQDACSLFLCPNNEVASRWQARYPNTPTAIVGCPRLDRYHIGYTPPPDTVAITFHWDCKVAPETRSAYPHYEAGMREIVRSYRQQGWTVLGHAHPRYASKLRSVWEMLQVPWTDDPLRDASVLVADNTSMIAEFLSCGRPVVALNAPWYRRDVHHGHRFWELDVTYANDTGEASQISLEDLPSPTHHPYAFADGRASERAAQAIVDLLR